MAENRQRGTATSGELASLCAPPASRCCALRLPFAVSMCELRWQSVVGLDSTVHLCTASNHACLCVRRTCTVSPAERTPSVQRSPRERFLLHHSIASRRPDPSLSPLWSTVQSGASQDSTAARRAESRAEAAEQHPTIEPACTTDIRSSGSLHGGRAAAAAAAPTVLGISADDAAQTERGGVRQRRRQTTAARRAFKRAGSLTCSSFVRVLAVVPQSRFQTRSSACLRFADVVQRPDLRLHSAVASRSCNRAMRAATRMDDEEHEKRTATRAQH